MNFANFRKNSSRLSSKDLKSTFTLFSPFKITIVKTATPAKPAQMEQIAC